jgi:propanediol dehydratase large subunit
MCVARLVTKPSYKLVLSIRDCASFNVQDTFEDVVLAAIADDEVSHAALPHTSSHVPV